MYFNYLVICVGGNKGKLNNNITHIYDNSLSEYNRLYKEYLSLSINREQSFNIPTELVVQFAPLEIPSKSYFLHLFYNYLHLDSVYNKIYSKGDDDDDDDEQDDDDEDEDEDDKAGNKQSSWITNYYNNLMSPFEKPPIVLSNITAATTTTTTNIPTPTSIVSSLEPTLTEDLNSSKLVESLDFKTESVINPTKRKASTASLDLGKGGVKVERNTKKQKEVISLNTNSTKVESDLFESSLFPLTDGDVDSWIESTTVVATNNSSSTIIPSSISSADIDLVSPSPSSSVPLAIVNPLNTTSMVITPTNTSDSMVQDTSTSSTQTITFTEAPVSQYVSSIESVLPEVSSTADSSSTNTTTTTTTTTTAMLNTRQKENASNTMEYTPAQYVCPQPYAPLPSLKSKKFEYSYSPLQTSKSNEDTKLNASNSVQLSYFPTVSPSLSITSIADSPLIVDSQNNTSLSENNKNIAVTTPITTTSATSSPSNNNTNIPRKILDIYLKCNLNFGVLSIITSDCSNTSSKIKNNSLMKNKLSNEEFQLLCNLSCGWTTTELDLNINSILSTQKTGICNNNNENTELIDNLKSESVMLLNVSCIMSDVDLLLKKSLEQYSIKGPLTLEEYCDVDNNNMSLPSTNNFILSDFGQNDSTTITSELCESLVQLNTPKLILGYQDEWIKVNPNLINIWEKLRLEPYSPKKNINFIVISPNNTQFLDDTHTYFKELSCLYEICNLGHHLPLSIENSKCQFPGFITFDINSEDTSKATIDLYEETCKYLASYLKSVGIQYTDACALVLYFIDPEDSDKSRKSLLHWMNFLSNELKQISSINLVFQIVPAVRIIRNDMFLASLKNLAFSIYSTTRRISSGPINKEHNKLYEPLFILADGNESISTIIENPLTLHCVYAILDNMIVLVMTDNKGELLQFHHFSVDENLNLTKSMWIYIQDYLLTLPKLNTTQRLVIIGKYADHISDKELTGKILIVSN